MNLLKIYILFNKNRKTTKCGFSKKFYFFWQTGLAYFIFFWQTGLTYFSIFFDKQG